MNMNTVFLIHGAYGNPQENWFPWLAAELQKLGVTVIAPKFPTPEDQSLDNWFLTFKNYEDFIDSETIFIAHSLGPAFVLRILERTKQPVNACFFVAPFIAPLGNPTFDDINKTFLESPFNWTLIRSLCLSFTVMSSDNDPYVPLTQGKELAEHLNTTCIVIPGAGHFNTVAGYTQFPLLLESVQSSLRTK